MNVETINYQREYQNAILEFQKQYNIKNRNVVVNSYKTQAYQLSTSQQKKDVPKKYLSKKDEQKTENPNKVQDDKKELNKKEVEKPQSIFSLENEMSKIKVYVPFNEFLKNSEYRRKIINMFKTENESIGILNLQDYYPTILFGRRVEEKYHDDDGEVPQFFISLSIHDMVLHNTMLDSGASQNLMPKAIMENLGLDIRLYKYLYSFDSKKVK